MQLKTIFTIFCLSFISQLFGQSLKRTLFIGNSYTYVNNMPQITADIATSMLDTLLFDSSTPGGYTLQGHSTNAVSLSKIAVGNWDFVVLQEQSQLPSFPISDVQANVFPYARKLDSLINSQNNHAETMFYRTWGRKNGDASNCATWTPVCTYNGMDSLLHERYMTMASNNHAVVSPVGAVWKYIRQYYPAIELYSSDESHPSAAGSYAAACCFYTAIFRRNPLTIPYNYTLSATDAENIRNAVKVVVYDQFLTWHIGEYDAVFSTKTGKVSHTLNCFPNPSSNEVYVALPQSNIQKVSVVDTYGKIQNVKYRLHENTAIFDVNALSAGIYFINIEIEGVIWTAKLIK